MATSRTAATQEDEINTFQGIVLKLLQMATPRTAATQEDELKTFQGIVLKLLQMATPRTCYRQIYARTPSPT